MLSPDVLAGHVERIATVGWTVVESAIEPELIASLIEDLNETEERLKVAPANNVFEGYSTLRVYNLLARSEIWQQVPVHANVLPIVEQVLDAGCLISSLSSIRIQPGEKQQPLHADDQLIPVARPHEPFVCNSMWALMDFTEENGATRLVSGSHLLDSAPEFGSHYETVPAEMESGSVLIWNGSLWHGGGANSTGKDRVGLAMNYCAGFLRQQENQQLGIPREVATTFSPLLQRLAGYGIYNGLMGHINKSDPKFLLKNPTKLGSGPMVWDAIG